MQETRFLNTAQRDNTEYMIFIRIRESYTAMRLLYTFGKTRFSQDVANLPTANLI